MRPWFALLLAASTLPVVTAAPPPPSLDLLAVAYPGLLTFGAEGSPPPELPPGAYGFTGQVSNGNCPAGAPASVRLLPAGGLWMVTVYVWRHHASAPFPPVVEHMTFTGELRLAGSCDGTDFRTDDLLMLPFGHDTQAFTAYLPLTLADGSVVSDVDAYPA